MKKRFFSLALCIALILSLSSCEMKDSFKERYGDYYDGYVDGYNDGVSEAQDSISDYVVDRFNDIDVDDAIQVITNYADGEPVTEAELHHAIWLIHSFYYDAWDVIWEIDDYAFLEEE